jgi:hypothetical protein
MRSGSWASQRCQAASSSSQVWGRRGGGCRAAGRAAGRSWRPSPARQRLEVGAAELGAGGERARGRRRRCRRSGRGRRGRAGGRGGTGGRSPCRRSCRRRRPRRRRGACPGPARRSLRSTCRRRPGRRARAGRGIRPRRGPGGPRGGRCPSAGDGGVDVLVAAERGEAVGEDGDDGAHLAGGDEAVEALGDALAEGGPGDAFEAGAGEAGEVDEDGVALMAAAIAFGEVDEDVADVGVAQEVVTQDGGVDGEVDELAAGLGERVDRHRGEPSLTRGGGSSGGVLV